MAYQLLHHVQIRIFSELNKNVGKCPKIRKNNIGKCPKAIKTKDNVTYLPIYLADLITKRGEF